MWQILYSQEITDNIIQSSDFLCGVLDIDRGSISKQNTSSIGSTTDKDDSLSEIIEQRLDFKHRCMFFLFISNR
jgi:hypothetical protein